MKILYLSAALLPSEISHSLSIMRFCQAFADAGHDVTLSGITLSRTPVDPTAFYGLRGGFKTKILRVNRIIFNKITRKLLLSGLYIGWKTRKLIDEAKPDAIYSRLTIAELFFVPKNIPILFETHSLGPLGESWWRNLAFRWLIKNKNFKRIIVTTKVMAAMVQETLPSVLVVIAPLSAEEPRIITPEETRALVQSLPGKNNFRIGYTGYIDIDGYRGIDVLVKIAEAMPDCDVHIVGGTPDSVAYWKSIATGSNIFFHGHQRSDLIPLYLSALDIVVSPLQLAPVKRAPTGKGLSLLKIPQYMAYGKAIVASDLPAHREVLEHEKTALLVPAHDIAAWVAALRRLKDDASLRGQLGHAAHAVYTETFTPQKRVETVLKDLEN